MEEAHKDSEKEEEVHGLDEEIAELIAEEKSENSDAEDTSSKKQVEDSNTELPPDEGVDYGTDIPTKDVKKYGFD